MRQLSQERFDSDQLENNIITALQEKGLITSKSPTMKVQNIILWIAGALALLIGGYLIGKQACATTTMPDDRRQYALFLYENETFQVTDVAALVEQYTQWAIDLGQKGQLAYAEKLSDNRTWLGSSAVQNQTSTLTGYFVFYAKDLEEAQQIARTHPHVGYGGGIELRPIDRLE